MSDAGAAQAVDVDEAGMRPSEAGMYRLSTDAAVQTHGQMVYAICLTHTRCVADAGDVFQEAFLTYHRKQPACRDAEHLKAWLIRVTLNCARRVATDSWRTRIVPLTPAMVNGLAETAQFRTPEQRAVFRALSELPDTYRSVLHLFYIEDQPIAQIALALDIEPGAVKMRLARGRVMVREALEAHKEDSYV